MVNIADNGKSYNNDNVLHAIVWFDFYGGLFELWSMWYIGGERDKKERDVH